MNSEQHPLRPERHRPGCPGGPCDCERQLLRESGVLDLPEFRAALREHDMQVVVRLLQRYGMSQRRIAALMGVYQREVSEMLCGRRHIVNYDVLVRIAEGLGIPRGLMGLAYDERGSEPQQNQ
jgi:predicted XRE-type DNA-binding protein